MPRFGADESFASTTSGGVFDSSGNPVISADNEFGGSPLGPAALAQTLFSVANGTFNLLPPIVEEPISNENPLPYWSAPIDNSDGVMTAQVIFDTTTNTYALRMTPGTAASGDTLSITTRSAVISDDNLSLRQKAIATLEKVGTYAGTTQVNLKLDATYYDHTGTQLSTQAIGTVFDNGTVSSITGFTTAGTVAVGISAAYVDLTFTLTATAAVTSGIAFDINTILLQTSQGGGGGGSSSFIITETFTSSATWTRPTGVENLLAVICVGGGGGGASGGLDIGTGSTTAVAEGGGGGGSGAFAYLTNVYIGTATSYTVTVGAGGSGGTSNSVTKADGVLATSDISPVQGAAGGTSSFSDLVFARGATPTGTQSAYDGGGGGIPTSPIWGIQFQSANGVNGGAGGRGGVVSNGTASVAGTFVAGTYTSLPLVSTSIPTPGAPTAATSGSVITSAFGAGTVFTAVGTAATTAGSGYFIQSGGGGGSGGIASSATSPVAGNGGEGQPGAGGGGGGAGVRVTGAGTGNNGSANITGGDGGNATGTAGAGGGGGGGAFFRANTGGTLTDVVVVAKSGKGGNGSQGFVIISYVG